MKMIWYEDMKADLRNVLVELNQFLGLKLTDDRLDQLKEHLSIDQMRIAATNAAADKEGKEWMSKFFRKGTVGDWRNHFSEEKQKVWDDWTKESLSGTTVASRFHEIVNNGKKDTVD